MIKKQIRYLLDFVPLLILLFYAIRLIWALSTLGFQIEWPNIAGFILLPIITSLFIWRHQIGVVSLGIFLILGLFGAVSFTPGISRFGISFGKGEPIVSFDMYGNPIYLLFLLIHFLISGRYYVGILTKQYWQQLFQVNAEELNK